jgi:ABC-type sugar transport system ATPase subunit
MDEPLSNLDAKLRIEARSFLTKMHHEVRTTTVYVTHDQSEAMTMGDTIVVMKDGLIQQAAAPLEVYNEPANMFVAGFIGSPAMNFLELSKADTKLVDREYIAKPKLCLGCVPTRCAQRRATPNRRERRVSLSTSLSILGTKHCSTPRVDLIGWSRGCQEPMIPK